MNNQDIIKSVVRPAKKAVAGQIIAIRQRINPNIITKLTRGTIIRLANMDIGVTIRK